MGWIEGIGGILKLLGFVSITYMMFYFAGARMLELRRSVPVAD